MRSHACCLAVVAVACALAAATDRVGGCDISVVGAGIGGVYSAWRLAVDAGVVRGRKICIFEAKERPGGRILSVDDPVPGFEGYTVDLGAYRYQRSTHHHVRLLTETALGIDTLCYTDPLERDGGECGELLRKIVSTRGKVFGINGTKTADDAFSAFGPEIPYVIEEEYQWGPNRTLEKPRTPRDFLVAVVKEIGARWVELTEEKDYVKAMRIADEIIESMKSGSYRGTPYSEVSLLQASVAEGWTPEEQQLFFDTDVGVGSNFGTRMSLENLGQSAVRGAALAADPIDPPKAMVTPVEQRDGISRRIGMKTIVEAMLRECENAGVRVFYGAKVTFLQKANPWSKRVLIKFADGRRVVSRKVILNIGKPDLIALGVESEPLKGSSLEFKRAIERLFIYSLAKTYCFWEDSWWLTKLNQTIGRTRTSGESIHSLRYHDGHSVCKDPLSPTPTSCRGGLLVSYDLGDNTGVGSAVYAHSHNGAPYTPLTNGDNLQRLIAGQMTTIQELYVADIHRQLKRVHASSLAANGFDAETAIPPPAGCVVGDWRDVGAHVTIGPGKGATNVYALFTRPVPGLDIALVNEAFGQESGWAEGAVNSAERALFHQYGLEKPGWMDEAFHGSVIRRYNLGTAEA